MVEISYNSVKDISYPAMSGWQLEISHRFITLNLVNTKKLGLYFLESWFLNVYDHTTGKEHMNRYLLLCRYLTKQLLPFT